MQPKLNDSSENQNRSISVVVPLFNEGDNVRLLHEYIRNALSQLDATNHEIIYIDDGSSDQTFPRLKEITGEDNSVVVIKFRGNCGQSAAIDAGFEYASGDIVIVMDGDLQNDPRDIPKLLEKIDEGYDLVSGWRKDRKDKFIIRKFPSFLANRLICSVTNVKLHDTGCALKAYRKKIIKSINLYGEFHRFLPALARVEGAEITEVPVNHHARKYGKSKYGLSRTFRVLMDLISLRLFIKYLQSPGRYFGQVALFLLFCSFLGSAGIILKLFSSLNSAEANVLFSTFFVFFTGGVQFLFLGLIGSLIINTSKKKKTYHYELITNKNGIEQ